MGDPGDKLTRATNTATVTHDAVAAPHADCLGATALKLIRQHAHARAGERARAPPCTRVRVQGSARARICRWRSAAPLLLAPITTRKASRESGRGGRGGAKSADRPVRRECGGPKRNKSNLARAQLSRSLSRP
ncbi:unnamed protein product [Lampetra planeri]